MLTLTNASKETKTILKWTGIILTIFFVIFILLRVFAVLRDRYFPPPSPKPTVSFGKILAPNFPLSVSNKSFIYTLDTVSGKLPLFSDQMRVYKIFKPAPDIIALTKIGSRVKQARFISGPNKISDTNYSWWTSNQENSLLRTIQVNIVNYNFVVSSDFMSDPQVLSAINLPDETTAQDSARNFLQSMDYLIDGIDLSKTQTDIYSIKNGVLIGATSLSAAQIIRVDFFQNDVNGLPIYYDKPNQSNINLLIAAGLGRGQVVAANYNFQSISNDYSTYPIKTTQEAFSQLKNSGAYVASYYGDSNKIIIKNVSLGYYLSNKEQNYLSPIIIFEGNDGFYAYVSAIRDEWVSK